MDIKELNKSQLILLAVLLSFVTSIATGITTVTLMQQAPASITTPINRVVQQTVEKIQQVEGKTVNQTVIIKEEDLVVDAIAKNQSAIFTVTKDIVDDQGILNEVSAGRGFAVSADNILATDALLVSGDANYYVKNSSGKFKAIFVSNDKSGFSLLKITSPLDPKNKLVFTVPTIGDLDKMKIGQKIIVLGNGISSLIYEGKNPILNVTKSNAGGLVMDLDGNALGIALSGDTSFVPIKNIVDALKPSGTAAPKTP